MYSPSTELTLLDEDFMDSSDDDEYLPSSRRSMTKKSFGSPTPGVGKRLCSTPSRKKMLKIDGHLVIMFPVFHPTEYLELLYIFLPSVPVETYNIRPKIVENGKKCVVEMVWSERILEELQCALGNSQILSMEFIRKLKDMHESQDPSLGANLKTSIVIPLPFQCEQKFYRETLIDPAPSPSYQGYQVLLGMNDESKHIPIFQMCLCRVKDNYSAQSSIKMTVKTISRTKPQQTSFFSPPPNIPSNTGSSSNAAFFIQIQQQERQRLKEQETRLKEQEEKFQEAQKKQAMLLEEQFMLRQEELQRNHQEQMKKTQEEAYKLHLQHIKEAEMHRRRLEQQQLEQQRLFTEKMEELKSPGNGANNNNTLPSSQWAFSMGTKHSTEGNFLSFSPSNSSLLSRGSKRNATNPLQIQANEGSMDLDDKSTLSFSNKYPKLDGAQDNF